MLTIGQTAYKVRCKNLCIRFGTWKVRRLIIDDDDKSMWNCHTRRAADPLTQIFWFCLLHPSPQLASFLTCRIPAFHLELTSPFSRGKGSIGAFVNIEPGSIYKLITIVWIKVTSNRASMAIVKNGKRTNKSQSRGDQSSLLIFVSLKAEAVIFARWWPRAKTNEAIKETGDLCADRLHRRPRDGQDAPPT